LLREKHGVRLLVATARCERSDVAAPLAAARCKRNDVDPPSSESTRQNGSHLREGAEGCSARCACHPTTKEKT
jgi:hypothetical protein